MKGSPILSTALACLIMLGMYIGMRMTLTKQEPQNNQQTTAGSNQNPAIHQTTIHAEIHLSHKAKSFTLTHPSTGEILTKKNPFNNIEWSGELSLPLQKLTSTEIEILCNVTWESPHHGHQFIQLTLSPDELDPQSQTLRAQGDITDVTKFHWKEIE